jgi:hypothetical protein
MHHQLRADSAPKPRFPHRHSSKCRLDGTCFETEIRKNVEQTEKENMSTEMLTCTPARVAPPERAFAARLSRGLRAAPDARSDNTPRRV